MYFKASSRARGFPSNRVIRNIITPFTVRFGTADGMRAYRRHSQHDAPRDAMSAESTGLGAIELEPLVSLPPVPEGPEPPVPEGPEGIAEFWINMAREEILAIKEEHKNSSERKDAIIDVLRKELEAARASALHWQTMYTAKAPAKEPELLAEAAGAGRVLV